MAAYRHCRFQAGGAAHALRWRRGLTWLTDLLNCAWTKSQLVIAMLGEERRKDYFAASEMRRTMVGGWPTQRLVGFARASPRREGLLEIWIRASSGRSFTGAFWGRWYGTRRRGVKPRPLLCCRSLAAVRSTSMGVLNLVQGPTSGTGSLRTQDVSWFKSTETHNMEHGVGK